MSDDFREVSGSGYSRGGNDRCPDVIPEWMAAGDAPPPNALELDGSNIGWGTAHVHVDEHGRTIWDWT